MRINIGKCDDSKDGGDRATLGTVTEARNAGNIGNIGKFCALRDSASVPEEAPLGCNETVGDFKLMGAGHDLFRGSLIKTK